MPITNLKMASSFELQECLSHKSGIELVSMIPTSNYQSAISSTLPEIGPMPAHLSQKVVEGAIVHAQGLVKPFDKFNALEQKILATTIILDYPMLNLEDVVLCVRLGASGSFGDTTHRFNAQTVVNWFYEYYILRQQQQRLMEMRRVGDTV